MKIRLISNTKLDLSSIVSDVDLEYGISFQGDNEIITKLLGDKVETKSYYQKNIDSKIIEIAKGVSYINQSLSEKHNENEESLRVQFLQHSNGTDDDIERKNKLEGAYSLVYEQFILLSNYSLDLLTQEFSESNKNDMIKFVLFHELGHIQEKKYNNNNQIFNFTKIMLKLLCSESRQKVYEKFSKEYNIPLVDKNLEYIATYSGEIYADIYALIQLRNYKIEHNEYNKESFMKFIDNIQEWRRSGYYASIDQLNYKKEEIYKNTLKSISHSTSNSLEELKLIIENDNIISEEKINDIALELMMRHTSRLIHVLNDYYLDIRNQFQYLFSITKDDLGNAIYDEDREIKYYTSYQNIMELAGAEWIKNYHEMRNDMKANPSLYYRNSPILYAIDTNKFKYGKIELIEKKEKEELKKREEEEKNMPLFQKIKRNIMKLRDKSQKNKVNLNI